MEQIKQERQCNSILDDNKNTFTVELNRSSRKSITHLEDLSNEIIFEIFDHLDFCHIYEAFSSLNIRFQSLLTHSNYPINISLSSISKSTFQRYYTEIVKPNEHRIKSLRLSNIFIINHILTPICHPLQLIRLETLILNNFQSKYNEELFHYLLSLPVLSRLIIIPVDRTQEKNKLYRQIYRLSALKYCKIQLNECTECDPLLITTNEFSSIEQLFIQDILYIDDFIALLSYVPQLRRLSVHCLYGPLNDRIELYPIMLNQLTSVDLDLQNISFDEFKPLVTKFFYQLEVLRLSVGRDKAYLDANKWQQLILSYMPYLRIFDIHVFYIWSSLCFSPGESIFDWKSLIAPFYSSFWFERQWFFAYQLRRPPLGDCLYLFSTDPYRRKHYTFHTEIEVKLSSNCQTTHINSVKNIIVKDERPIAYCLNYFPNAIKLELSTFHLRNPDWQIFNRILPLQQLTKVVFDNYDCVLENVISLLSLTSNLHTLIITNRSRLVKSSVSPEENKNFQLVSNTNHIKNLTINSKHLTTSIFENSLESVLQFLLSKNNINTRHLYSLCINGMLENSFKMMKTLIESGKLLDDYLMEKRDNHLADIDLWW